MSIAYDRIEKQEFNRFLKEATDETNFIIYEYVKDKDVYHIHTFVGSRKKRTTKQKVSKSTEINIEFEAYYKQYEEDRNKQRLKVIEENTKLLNDVANKFQTTIYSMNEKLGYSHQRLHTFRTHLFPNDTEILQIKKMYGVTLKKIGLKHPKWFLKKKFFEAKRKEKSHAVQIQKN